MELSAPTKNHVKKLRKANTPIALENPRQAEKIEYKISVNKMVFFRPM